MRIVKILGILVGLVLVVIISAMIYVATVDVDEYRDDIAAAVRDATGRDLRLSGAMELELGRDLRLVIEDVGIGNAEWASRPELASLKRLELVISILPLISQRLVIQRVVMIEPDVLLETNADGLGNWVLAPPTPGKQAVDNKNTAASDGTDMLLEIEQITLRRAMIVFKDGQSDNLHNVRIDELTADREPGDMLSLAVNADWNGQKISANGKVGRFQTLLPGNPYPIDLDITFAGIDLTLRGQIADPIAATGIDLAVGAKAKSLEGLVPIAGKSVRHVKDIDLKTQVKGDMSAFHLDPLTLKLGNSDLSGGLSVTMTGKRPAITGKLVSKLLDVSALLPPAKGEAKANAEKSTRVFSNDPFVLDGMKAVDARLDFRGEEVIVPSLTLKPLTTVLTLKDGRFAVDPLVFGLADGTVDVKAKVDGTTATPNIALDARSQDLNLKKLLTQLEVTDLLEGTLSLDIGVTGSGQSVAAIMAGLNGRSLLLMGKGRAKTAAFDVLVGGLSQVLGTLRSGKSEWTVVECIASDFAIKKGVATSKVMLFDTDFASVTGEGNVNLGTERLNFKITPKPKSATLNISVPVKVRGTILKPSFAPDELATASKLAGLLGGLVFPPAALLAFGDLGGENHPCVKSAGAVNKKSEGSTPPSTKASDDDAAGGIKNPIEGVTKGLKDLFGIGKKKKD